MPTVYIHIGQHRTGTTSLQNFLAANRNVLYEKGFIYPEFLKPASSHFFAWHCGFGNRNLTNEEHEQVRAVLQKTKREALENSKDILISSEILFSNIRKSALKKIREQFTGFDVKIICYLRRQDEYIQSYYTQYIKYGNTLDVNAYVKRKMFRWYHRFLPPAFNWYNKLKPYASVFAKENIFIRPFEKQQLEGGDVVADFLYLLGIDKGGLTIPDQYDNASFPAEGIQLLRYLNSVMPVKNSSKGDGQKTRRYVEILERYYSRNESGQKQGISPTKCKAIAKRFANGNRKIAQEFTGTKDEILFMGSIAENNSGNESIDMDQQEIIQLLVKILSDQHQEIKYLERNKGSLS